MRRHLGENRRFGWGNWRSLMSAGMTRIDFGGKSRRLGEGSDLLESEIEGLDLFKL